MKKFALVTGVESSNISKCICKKLLVNGYEVVATYYQPSDDNSTNTLTFDTDFENNHMAHYESVDYLSRTSMQEYIDRLQTYSFDLVVNCTSSLAITNNGALRNEFLDFDYNEFNRVLQLNITSVAAVCVGLKDNIKAGGAVIVLSSSAADDGAFSTISYNASKAALNNLTKSLANNFGSYNNIRVCSVSPGWIPVNSSVVAEGILALADSLTPSHNRGRADDVAEAILYISQSPFLNGANICIDGGLASSYLMYFLESLELDGKDVSGMVSELTRILNKSRIDFKRAQ